MMLIAGVASLPPVRAVDRTSDWPVLSRQDGTSRYFGATLIGCPSESAAARNRLRAASRAVLESAELEPVR